MGLEVVKSLEALGEDSKASERPYTPIYPTFPKAWPPPYPHWLLPWYGWQGERISYQDLLQALPQALPVLAWFCGSSWPAALQTSVPWGFQTGTSPLAGGRMRDEHRTDQCSMVPNSRGRPLTVISPFFLASFINFFLFFFPLKAKSNSCRALATGIRTVWSFRGYFIMSLKLKMESN